MNEQCNPPIECGPQADSPLYSAAGFYAEQLQRETEAADLPLQGRPPRRQAFARIAPGAGAWALLVLAAVGLAALFGATP